jgi:WD40 repeat protein
MKKRIFALFVLSAVAMTIVTSCAQNPSAGDSPTPTTAPTSIPPTSTIAPTSIPPTLPPPTSIPAAPAGLPAQPIAITTNNAAEVNLLKQWTDTIELWSVALSPDGLVLAYTNGKLVKLCDIKTESCPAALGSHNHLDSAVFSPDGNLLVGGGYGVGAWNVKTQQEVFSTSSPFGVMSVAISPDGKLMASGSNSDGGRIYLWNVETGDNTTTFYGHKKTVTSLAFSPDGTLLASASQDATARLWDVKTGASKAVLRGSDYTHEVSSVVFSPDGSLLAVASSVIQIWDVKTIKVIATFQGDNDYIPNSLAFNPDGSLLAAGAWAGTVWLWNIKTGQPVVGLKGHTSKVTDVAFSPDGTLLASASFDKTVRLWGIPGPSATAAQ